MTKNKVVLHVPSGFMWLCDSVDECDDTNELLVELSDVDDGIQCLKEIETFCIDPRATVDLALELGIATNDDCCVYLHGCIRSLESKFDEVMYREKGGKTWLS